MFQLTNDLAKEAISSRLLSRNKGTRAMIWDTLEVQVVASKGSRDCLPEL